MDIHRCRFVDYIPSQIHALAFSHPSPPNPQSHPLPPSLRLAIGRSNGSIEIWNPTTWFHESTLHGGQNRSIEGLAWIRQSHYSVKHTELLRLFSIGNSTVVTEWDLVTGRPLAHFDCGKGVIWSIAAQPRKNQSTTSSQDADSTDTDVDDTNDGKHLTVGCEDGSLVILNVGDAPGSLSLAKIIPQSKPCRVLSLSYQTPTTVIAGTSDSRLRAFDTVTGRILATMSVAPKITSKRRNSKKRDTYVWTVKCLPSSRDDGGWIVAGDSLGEISIYDGKRYTLRQKLKAHEADVLTIETNAAGTQLFSSGVDRVTVKHELVGMGRRAVWTEVAKKRFHRHDVRAMAGFESGLFSVLVSGGVDMTPIVVPLRRFAEEYQYTLSALPQYQVCSTTVGRAGGDDASARLLVARFDREVKIWKVATIDEVEAADDVELYGAVDEDQGRKLVGQIMVNTDENIASAAISPAGNLLAISTMATIKLFHLRPRKSSALLRISKLDLPPSIADISARKLLFSPTGDYLAAIAPNSEPYIVRITSSTTADDDKPTFTFSPPQHLDRKDREPAFTNTAKLQRKDGVIALGRGYERQISQLSFSPSGTHLFAADVGGWMEAWTLEAGTYKLIKPALPRLPSSPAAICFRPPSTTGADSTEVFVMTADHSLHEFNILNGQVTAWSARNSTRLPRAFTKLKDRCFGMLAVKEPGKGRRIWCYGHAWVYMFNVDRDLPPLKPKPTREASSSAATGVKRKRTVVMTSGAGAEAVGARRDMVRGTEVTVVGKRVEGAEDEMDLEEDVDSEDEFLVDKVRNDRAVSGAVELVDSDSDSDSDSSAKSDADEDSDNSDAESEISASEHPDIEGGVKIPTDNDTMDIDRAVVPADEKAGGIPYWHTFQYRNILAFQPIGDPSVDVEVVVVERPVGDVKLPPAWVPRRGGNRVQKFV
ncbi:U3 small nucleolar RNA-associated protein [Orbilia brochopaga]|uniref:U3 small nucleolar RNA-associated protein n=1 Tax=Orbilia brochopaga TaxID=3140254 RepID=A0AAV9URX7_9PEZI